MAETIMESQDYEHYRNLTLMFFLEKLVDKGGKYYILYVQEVGYKMDHYFLDRRYYMSKK